MFNQTDLTCANNGKIAAGNRGERRHKTLMLAIGAVALLLGASGCSYNPIIGKWEIVNRNKETYASYVDPLSKHIKKQTGNNTIVFAQNSFEVTGGSEPATEQGIHYQVTELPGGEGNEVKIYQPRKDEPNNYDIDTARVSPDGKSAHLETPNTIVDLKKINQ